MEEGLGSGALYTFTIWTRRSRASSNTQVFDVPTGATHACLGL